MSSTYNQHVGSNCIDGSINTFCHTDPNGEWPWLSLQLPTNSTVSYARFTNRAECCQDRLSPFQLWVGAFPGDYNSATSASCSRPDLGDNVNLTVPDDGTYGPYSFRCMDNGGNALVGTYLTLVLPGSSRTLHISEIYA